MRALVASMAIPSGDLVRVQAAKVTVCVCQGRRSWLQGIEDKLNEKEKPSCTTSQAHH